MRHLLVFLLLTTVAWAQQTDFPPPVTLTVLHPVHPARVGEKTALVYELFLQNYGPGLDLKSLEVLDDTDRPLKSFTPEELSYIVVGPRTGPVLQAGRQSILYMWLDTPVPPKSLHHRITLANGKTVEGGEIPVVREKLPVLGAPFPPGGLWVAESAPANDSLHRRTLLPIHGALWLSQRFAIDWLRVNEEGQTHVGDPLRNENYFCHGVEALAAADATVVGTKDGIPENVPGEESRAVVITPETVGGNWVALDLGDGRYAMYAHLIPGSIKVRPGQKVKQGEVLGRVGNTGNSTEPHLHFHVATAPRWLEADGLPYLFSRFRSYEKPGGHPTVRADQMPSKGQLVEF